MVQIGRGFINVLCVAVSGDLRVVCSMGGVHVYEETPFKQKNAQLFGSAVMHIDLSREAYTPVDRNLNKS